MKRQNKTIIRLNDTNEIVALVRGNLVTVVDKIAYAEQEDLSDDEEQ